MLLIVMTISHGVHFEFNCVNFEYCSPSLPQGGVATLICVFVSCSKLQVVAVGH